MSRGLYTAASGMLSNLHRQVALSNQLANVNTPGYKGDRFTSRSFPGVLLAASGGNLRQGLGQLGSGAILDTLGPDLASGTLVQTESMLDVAVDGDGFFVVQDADGNTRLTRDGHFSAADDGSLVTSEGFQLLSEANTPIVVEGTAIEITRDRRVLVDGELAGIIQISNAPADALLRAGASSFIVEDGVDLEAATGQTVQGSLEGSNVKTTTLMTQMVSVARAYESAQRIFAMQNQTLGQTVSTVGRV